MFPPMNVYPPSEDTFLLEDALRSTRESPRIIVEVGSGSGYVSRVLREIYPQAFVVSTDINLEAARTSSTRDANGDACRMGMLDALRHADMAVFNPTCPAKGATSRAAEWTGAGQEAQTGGR